LRAFSSAFVFAMAFFSNLKITNCGQKGRIVVASNATWYQLAIFELDFSKSKFKTLVGLCPNPLRSASCDAGCAFLQNAFLI